MFSAVFSLTNVSNAISHRVKLQYIQKLCPNLFILEIFRLIFGEKNEIRVPETTFILQIILKISQNDKTLEPVINVWTHCSTALLQKSNLKQELLERVCAWWRVEKLVCVSMKSEKSVIK